MNGHGGHSVNPLEVCTLEYAPSQDMMSPMSTPKKKLPKQSRGGGSRSDGGASSQAEPVTRRGRPKEHGPVESVSYRLPLGTKDRIRVALAQLQLLDGTDAPKDAQAFVLAALEEKVAATQARYARRR